MRSKQEPGKTYLYYFCNHAICQDEIFIHADANPSVAIADMNAGIADVNVHIGGRVFGVFGGKIVGTYLAQDR